MAVEVLRRNPAAAAALSDKLAEDRDASLRLPVIYKLTANKDKLRIALYAKDDMVIGPEEIIRLVADLERWLKDGRTIILSGIDRIEMYELP